LESNENQLWQHFKGIEIETTKDFFDEKIMNLMDFDCQQYESVHFFYTLPFSKNKAMVETTWLSKMNNNLEMDYDQQLKNYIENHLNIKNYKINYKENGAIPLFYPSNINEKNKINIGTAGHMTRLSTGYTFLNIQEHSRFIRENIDNIDKIRRYEIKKKYQFLDKIFLRVLNNHANQMPNIFFKMFDNSPETVIKFLSNKSNIFQDLLIILKTAKKWLFIKALLK
jgi:lycopene beta-cyclase